VNYINDLAEAIRRELDPRTLPDEPVELLRAYAVLALALGDEVTAEDVHNAWVAWMLPRHPEHPALVPYADLDAATAAQDLPFVEAIKAVAQSRRLVRDPASGQ
jgi:hypothetical protein